MSYKGALFFLLGLLLSLSLFYLFSPSSKFKSKKEEIPVLTTGKPELCLLCHEEKIPEKAHAREVLGCSSCHLGNPLTPTMSEAHKGLVKNPSDLRVIEKTCGKANCHPQDVKKVRNSLMATNHGIITRLLKVFEEKEILQAFPNIKVADLYEKNSLLDKSYALDYFRKLCGSCHLYLQKEKFEGFLAEKGGGCSACHLEGSKEDLRRKKIHPGLTKKISLNKCVKCHNRSGRIGFTYQGLYETSQGGIYDRLWVDERQLKEIEPDVHFKSSLQCIDCHTREEVMGDGNFYKNLEEALEVTCETCHLWELKTKKGRTLSQLIKTKKGVFLKRKIDEKLLLVKRPSPVCQEKIHSRLSCSACHAKYMPQCMGCHVRLTPGDTQLDKIKAKETKGLWEEHESYRVLEDPPLVVKGNKIVPVTPGCQDFVTLLDKKGEPKKYFESITWAHIEPHSTQKKGRSCKSCHQNPKALGLGYGQIILNHKQISFHALEKPITQKENISLSQIVDLEGRTLVKFNRREMRGFTKEELKRILRVGLCLNCHEETSSFFRRWKKDIFCPKYPEL